MPYINERKYDSLAKDAVDAFLSDDTPLSDSVYKYASDNGMLPDQVKQLVWRTNTLAHLTLFEKKAEDKVIDFPVADAANVLSRLYDTTTDKTASAYTESVLDRDIDYFTSLNTEEDYGEDLTKVAAFSEDYATPTTTRRDDSIFTLRKVASELEIRALSSRDTYIDTIQEAVTEVRKLASNPLRDGEMQEVFHDVCSAFGTQGEDALRDCGLAPAEGIKHASIVDTTHPLFITLRRAVRSKEAALKAIAAYNLISKATGNK